MSDVTKEIAEIEEEEKRIRLVLERMVNPRMIETLSKQLDELKEKNSICKKSLKKAYH